MFDRQTIFKQYITRVAPSHCPQDLLGTTSPSIVELRVLLARPVNKLLSSTQRCKRWSYTGSNTINMIPDGTPVPTFEHVTHWGQTLVNHSVGDICNDGFSTVTNGDRFMYPFKLG